MEHIIRDAARDLCRQSHGLVDGDPCAACVEALQAVVNAFGREENP